MAYFHAIKLTFGSTDYDLMSTNVVVTDYEMRSSEANMVQPTKENPYGYGRVTESYRLFIEDSTQAAALTRYENLERFLQEAVNQQREFVNTKLRINFQLSPDAGFWSSPVVAYNLTPTKGFLTSIPQGKIEAELQLTREFYIEYARTQLSLTSATAGPATKVRINNSHQNYAYTSSSAVTGTLPAPALTRVYNASGSNISMKNVYIGVNANQNPTALQHIFQGEDVLSFSGLTSQSDATSSGGYYKRNAYTSGSGAYFAWTPSTAVLNAMAGNMFRVFAKFKNAPASDLFLRMGVGTYVSPLYLPVWENPEVLNVAGRQLFDFGSMRIPHGNFTNDINYSAGFHITSRPINSGNLDLDFVCIMPASGVRHLYQVPSLNTPNNDYVADNSRDGEAYLYSGSTKYPVFEQYGSPVLLWPQKTNYIYVLTDTSSLGASAPLTALDVELFCWPRRLTI